MAELIWESQVINEQIERNLNISAAAVLIAKDHAVSSG